MPFVKRIGPYRFHFYASDGDEPRHIHVWHDRSKAKFWLMPVRLAKNIRFSPAEILKLQRLVEEHQQEFMEAWDAYFRT